MEPIEILRMAEQAGFGKIIDGEPPCWNGYDVEMIEKFAKLVIDTERQECMMIAFDSSKRAGSIGRHLEAMDIATKIRERK